MLITSFPSTEKAEVVVIHGLGIVGKLTSKRNSFSEGFCCLVWIQLFSGGLDDTHCSCVMLSGVNGR